MLNRRDSSRGSSRGSKRYNWVSLLYVHAQQVKHLSDAEQLQFFKAWLAYGLYDRMPRFDPEKDRAVLFVWEQTKRTTDKMRARLGDKLLRFPKIP